MTSDEVDIVLVHGTFARLAPWTREDSALCRSLRALLPDARIHAFPWSGRNSHSARIKAGRELAEYLRDEQAAKPGRRRVLIAHSHGGNVVLYALRYRQVPETVAGCVFLATPFLRTRVRPLGPFVSTLAFQLTWMALWLAGAIPLWIWLGFNGLLFSAVFVFFGIPLAAGPLDDRVTKRIGRFLLDRLTRTQTEFRRRVAMPKVPTPFLVCQVGGDEARAWLRWIDRAASASFVANRYLVAFAGTWPLLLLVSMIGAVVDGWILDERRAFVIRSGLLGFGCILASLFLIVAMAVFLPAASVVLRGHLGAFGWEGLLGYSLVDIYASKTPEGALEASVIEHAAPRGDQALRHGRVYEEPVLLEAISGWVAAQCREPSPRALAGDGPAAVPNAAPGPPPAKTEAPSYGVRCWLLQCVLLAVGTAWTVFTMVHRFDFVAREVKRGPVSFRETLVAAAHYELAPREPKVIEFSTARLPTGSACHLVGAFTTDSVEGHIAVGLEHGPARWESAAFCRFPGKFAYTNDLEERQSDFSAPIETGQDGRARGCVALENLGKKVAAAFDVSLSLVCLASPVARSRDARPVP